MGGRGSGRTSPCCGASCAPPSSTSRQASSLRSSCSTVGCIASSNAPEPPLTPRNPRIPVQGSPTHFGMGLSDESHSEGASSESDDGEGMVQGGGTPQLFG